MKTKSGKRFECIGMIHLLPLPGSPGFDELEGLQPVIDRAEQELDIYVKTGLSGAIFENLGDAPYFPGRVPPETVAAMTRVVTSCLNDVDPFSANGEFSIGINVLRNDAISAIAISKAVGAQFVRVNVHDGAAATDQGIISGTAHETLRYRKAIGAENVLIYADVRVKHATPLQRRPVLQESEDLVARALVDGALVYTGVATGAEPAADVLSQLPRVREALPRTKLLVGSGATAGNIASLARLAGGSLDGCIVGTSLKDGGVVRNVVDESRVRALVKAIEAEL
ncbi:MAG: BtpA/SgcQ family protein [Candidatus Lokiarchaeota archaeon]|nr:BtpA/SgcQ family protein [Candidatus Lokiarchaeota archaeon]